MNPYNAPVPKWETDRLSQSPYPRPSSAPIPPSYTQYQSSPHHHPPSGVGANYQGSRYPSPPPVWKRRKQLDTPPRHQRSYFPRTIDEPAQASTVVWDEEDTLCLVVDLNGDRVVRRCDNNMINGTKLLNAAKVSRGRRDGILKSEPTRSVTKLGQTSFKGVWIPFERALEIARAEGVARALQPLFHRDIQRLLYHEGNLTRTQQVVRSVMPRKPQFAEWLHGFPSRCSSVHELRAHAQQQPIPENVPPVPNYAAKPKLDTAPVFSEAEDTDLPVNNVYPADSIGKMETQSPELVQVNSKQPSPYLEPSCIDVTPTDDSYEYMDDYIDWDHHSLTPVHPEPEPEPEPSLEGFDWSFYEAW